MLSSFSGDSTPTGKGELQICCFCKKTTVLHHDDFIRCLAFVIGNPPKSLNTMR